MTALEQGDIIEVDFNPSVGHEPAKTRPALVVSGYGFNTNANLVAVVPITTKNSGFPLHVPVTTTDEIVGFACVEQLRTIDLERRGYRLAGTADHATLRSVLSIIRGMFELR